jgi:hypothetical protein
MQAAVRGGEEAYYIGKKQWGNGNNCDGQEPRESIKQPIDGNGIGN